MIGNDNIDLVRWRRYYPFNALNAWISIAESGGTEIIPQGGNTGKPGFIEVSTFGFSGFDIDNNDIINFILGDIFDFDPTYPLGFKLHYCSDSVTAADDFTPVMLLNLVAQGAAFAEATSALNTTFGNQVQGTTTQFANLWTSRGIRNGGWATRAQIEAGAVLNGKITFTPVDQSAFSLLGILVDFVPYICIGGGSHTDRPLTG